MLSAWLMVPVASFGAGTLWGPVPGILVLIAVCAAIGLINGVMIVKFRLNGFIWTLAMTIILYGFQDGITTGQTLPDEPAAWSYLGSHYWGQIPVSLVFTAVVFIGVGLFLRYHRWGRDIYAVGGNRAAARAAGIRVDRIRIGVYVAGSVLAAIGGLMEAGRYSWQSPARRSGLPRGHHLQRLCRGGDRRGELEGRPRRDAWCCLRRDPPRSRAEHP